MSAADKVCVATSNCWKNSLANYRSNYRSDSLRIVRTACGRGWTIGYEEWRHHFSLGREADGFRRRWPIPRDQTVVFIPGGVFPVDSPFGLRSGLKELALRLFIPECSLQSVAAKFLIPRLAFLPEER